QYMAPEQTMGGEVDGRTDLYALGIILYEMLTGRLPFDGTDPAEFLRHQLATKLPPMKKRAAQVAVPDWAEALVKRLCEKQPDDRFKSAEAFLEALEGATQENKMTLAPARTRASSPSARDSQSGASGAGTPPVPAATPPGPAAAAPAPMRLPQTASMVMF